MKQELRKLMKERLAQFSCEEQEDANERIQQEAYQLLQGYHVVGIYLNMEKEVSTRKLINRLMEAGVELVAPVCVENDLLFRRFTGYADTVRNHYGILEPQGEMVQRETIDAIVVPMVAFSDTGYRLGHGKGYYDRYLYGYHGYKLGFAYALQQLPSVQEEPHDIPLDAILTEQCYWQFPQKR